MENFEIDPIPDFAENFNEVPLFQSYPEGWQSNYEKQFKDMEKNWSKTEESKVEVSGGYGIEYNIDGFRWFVIFTDFGYREYAIGNNN